MPGGGDGVESRPRAQWWRRGQARGLRGLGVGSRVHFPRRSAGPLAFCGDVNRGPTDGKNVILVGGRGALSALSIKVEMEGSEHFGCSSAGGERGGWGDGLHVDAEK